MGATAFRCWMAVLLLPAATVLAAGPQQTLVLDGNQPGKLFEGVGAVSGGGATSVLLKDYPQPQRDQILDILFKPHFAASMQTLYVEVGSDGNSTQGSEPTHMRTRADQNYWRGYEWWLMAQAKQRNPALTLDACAWGCPGWVGDGQFWSQDMADYYVKWIKGLKSEHGLNLDAIGCRNERGVVTDWVKLFRRTLDANDLNRVRIHAFDNAGNWKWDWCPQLETDPALAAAVDIIGNHTVGIGPQPPIVEQIADRLHKPIWNTEEHVYDGEGRRYADDFACALGAVHLFNDDFISHGVTKIVNWYLAGSTYGFEPYADQPPAVLARWPWCGHYVIKPIIWAYAHYGQFTQVGWHYVPGGCAALAGGGTVVTLRSPGGDYSLIAETAGAASPQQLTIRRGPRLSAASLCLWRTTRDAQFVRLADPVPTDAGATFTLTLEPDAIYSLSTTTGQQKGTYPDVPAEQPFPFPYSDHFDHYGSARKWGYLPHYTADICGVFELADRPDHAGLCLRQVVERKPQSWAPEWMPYTVIGDSRWTDYQVSANIYLDDDGWAGVIGRVNSTGNGWDGDPNGYYARLYPDGGCAVYAADQNLRGSRDRQLAVGEVKNWKWHQWHTLMLQFQNQSIRVLVDGQPVLSVDDSRFDHGAAGLICGGEGSARNTALYDDLLINRVSGGAVPPTSFPQDAAPIYP